MTRLDVDDLFSTTTEIVFQPGDATRYEIVVALLADGDYLIAWTNRSAGGVAMRTADIDDLYDTYVAEKMGLDRTATDRYSAGMICKALAEWRAL